MTWKTVKGFSNRSNRTLSDVGSAPDDAIWTEIWGDEKRFNSISIYCDDENTSDGDGCWRHQCYSTRRESLIN